MSQASSKKPKKQSNALDYYSEHEQKDLEKIWNKYRKGDKDAYEILVDIYLPLVKATVGRLSLNIPTFVSREDLYSAGCLGLISAIERYEPEKEAKFTTYAITRIRGSIIDELRSQDTLGRIVRDRVNRIEKATAELKANNSNVTPEEVAQLAGMTIEEYWDAELGAQTTKRVSIYERNTESGNSLAEILVAKNSDNPGARLEIEEVIGVVMTMLNEKEKMLVVMYYEEELTLKEIGYLLNVTESRVCQMHTALIGKIRKKLEEMGIYN